MQKSLSYKPYTLFQPARNRNNQPQEPQQPTQQPTEARQRKRAARALRVSAGDHSTGPGRQCRQAMAKGPTTKGRRDYKQPLGSLGEITALGGQAGQLQVFALERNAEALKQLLDDYACGFPCPG